MVVPQSALTEDPDLRALGRVQIGRALAYPLLLVTAGAARLTGAAAPPSWPGLLLLVAIGEASALAASAALARGGSRSVRRLLDAAWIAVDVGLFAWLMLLTGGSASAWSAWALVGVSAAAFVLGWRGAAGVLAAELALYLVVAVMTEGATPWVFGSAVVRILVVAVAALLGLAVLANARSTARETADLRRQVKGSTEDLAELRRELEERTGQVERLTREMRSQAVTDPLTGLHNRAYLKERIREDLAAVRRARAHQRAEEAASAHATDLGLVLLDVDGFGEVNRRHGEALGDELLRHLARVVESTVRGQDSVLRWGDDELLVVLRSLRPDELPEVVRRVQGAVTAEPLTTPDGTLPVSCSAGYCPFPLADLGRLGWEDAVNVAASALLLARASGPGGRVGVVPGSTSLDQPGVTLLLADLQAAAQAGCVRLLVEGGEPRS